MKHVLTNIALVVGSIVCSLFFLELAFRIYHNNFNFQNYIATKRNLFSSAYPSQYDKELGWVPKPGRHTKNIWNTEVTIHPEGIRDNAGTGDLVQDRLILAVGDSFTFGDQVSDHETWPARLEQLSRTRVINGGVFGYGMDQTFLRMHTLAAVYQPDIIIFSLIPDDISRCEMAVRTSVPKPYYQINKDSSLTLINDHVMSYDLDIHALMGFRQIFGHSYMAHTLMSDLAPEYWLQGSRENTRVHSNGAQVACQLFKKLKQYAEQSGTEIIVLLQHTKKGLKPQPKFLIEAMNCIDRDMLTFIDTADTLQEIKQQDSQRYDSLYTKHMTKQGNDLIASILWQHLRDLYHE